MNITKGHIICFALGSLIGFSSAIGAVKFTDHAPTSQCNSYTNELIGTQDSKPEVTEYNYNEDNHVSDYDKTIESNQGEVVITKNGKKFHSLSGCPSSNRAKVKKTVMKEEAEKNGYEACLRCF